MSKFIGHKNELIFLVEKGKYFRNIFYRFQFNQKHLYRRLLPFPFLVVVVVAPLIFNRQQAFHHQQNASIGVVGGFCVANCHRGRDTAARRLNAFGILACKLGNDSFSFCAYDFGLFFLFPFLHEFKSI